MKIDWTKYNIFSGLSWQQIGIAICAGTLLAFIALVIILLLVSILPISDNLKLLVLFILGLISFSIGISIKAKKWKKW